MKEIEKQLQNIRRCAQTAPEGAYTKVKETVEMVGDLVEGIRSTFKENGYKARGDDSCFRLEAAIYQFLLDSNPDAFHLMTGEGFGEHIDGPAGGRIMTNTIRDLAAFKAMHRN